MDKTPARKFFAVVRHFYSPHLSPIRVSVAKLLPA
jgi:hypothetical protein